MEKLSYHSLERNNKIINFPFEIEIIMDDKLSKEEQCVDLLWQVITKLVEKYNDMEILCKSICESKKRSDHNGK